MTPVSLPYSPVQKIVKIVIVSALFRTVKSVFKRKFEVLRHHTKTKLEYSPYAYAEIIAGCDSSL